MIAQVKLRLMLTRDVGKMLLTALGRVAVTDRKVNNLFREENNSADESLALHAPFWSAAQVPKRRYDICLMPITPSSLSTTLAGPNVLFLDATL